MRPNSWGAKEVISRGASLARTDMAMDAFINEEDKNLLYNKWDKEWGEPLVYNGGVLSITTNLVAEAPWDGLVSAFGIRKAKYFKNIAEQNKR